MFALKDLGGLGLVLKCFIIQQNYSLFKEGTVAHGDTLSLCLAHTLPFFSKISPLFGSLF